MKAGMAAALVAVMVGSWGGVASGHEFVCEKRVGAVQSLGVASQRALPGEYLALDGYPVGVAWYLKITNVHPTAESQALWVTDDLLDAWLKSDGVTAGFVFDPAPPFWVPVGESANMTVYPADIESYEDCLRLAALDGTADEFIDNTLEVGWDHGSTQCSARIECICPQGHPDCTEPTGGATRSHGYYRTHPKALAECLKDDGITLGYLTIPEDDVNMAMGLMWADIAKYSDDERRSAYDKDWLKLAKETLTAICTERIYGTVAPDGLVAAATGALSDGTCDSMADLFDALEDFNTSNEIASPWDGVFNPADPPDPIPADPTVDTGLSCRGPPSCSATSGSAFALAGLGVLSLLAVLRRRARK